MAPPATAMALPIEAGVQEGYTETLAEVWLIRSYALLVMMPGSVGITTTSMVAVAPEGRVPRSHSTLPEPFDPPGTKLHSPWLDAAETNFTPAGGESLTWGPRAKDSLLVSVIVKVTGSPTAIESALAVLVK